MKRNIAVFFFSLFIFLVGCSKNNTIVTPPSNSTGGLTFKIDPHSVPTGINVISAKLTRTGYTDITQNLNLLSDSTGDITIPAVPIGTWHLKIDAKDNNGTILYTGETDVTVQENVVVQLNLTLNPVSSGTGIIYIFVTWGTNAIGQWIDFGGNPILTRYSNPSLPNAIDDGKILYDNGLYKMWYEGITNSATGSVWYAESQDGLSWNTIVTSPVLTKGVTGTWDSYMVYISAVVKVGSVYKMYYTGRHYYNDDISTGIAFSTDGIHWTKNASPIIGITAGYFHFNFTDVIIKDSTYYGYFGYSTTDNTTDGGVIGVAISTDGLSWNRQSILFPTLPWESGSVGSPSVIYDGGMFKMIYQNGIGTGFGMATSPDGINFIKQGDPVFKYSNTFKYPTIWYPNYRKINNISYIYYTGQSSTGDLTICVTRN
jgi:predicted GH43/DUF377 family glycosyl hydrolase